MFTPYPFALCYQTSPYNHSLPYMSHTECLTLLEASAPSSSWSKHQQSSTVCGNIFILLHTYLTASEGSSSVSFDSLYDTNNQNFNTTTTATRLMFLDTNSEDACPKCLINFKIRSYLSASEPPAGTGLMRLYKNVRSKTIKNKLFLPAIRDECFDSSDTSTTATMDFFSGHKFRKCLSKMCDQL
jgi:hypothetical protein